MKWKLLCFFALSIFVSAFLAIQQKQIVIVVIVLTLITVVCLWIDWKFALVLLTIIGALLLYTHFIPTFRVDQIWKQNFIRTPFTTYLDKNTSGEFNQYLKLFLINQTTKNSLYQSALKLNIVHLYVISGLHLSFLFNAIERWIYKRWHLNKLCSFIVLGVYIFLVGFAFSALRVFISKGLKIIFKKQLLEENLSLTALLILCLSPGALNAFSFKLSFLASFVLLAFQKFKLPKFVKLLLLPTTILFVVSPLTLQINQKINALSVLHNLLFTPLALFYFCASWVMVPFLGLLGNHGFGFYLPLKLLTTWALQATVFLEFFKPNSIFYLIYYGLGNLFYTLGVVLYYDSDLRRRCWFNSTKIKTAQGQFFRKSNTQ